MNGWFQDWILLSDWISRIWILVSDWILILFFRISFFYWIGFRFNSTGFFGFGFYAG
jgi:hypothetical protein